MAFSRKTWYNEEDSGATDDNSVLNKNTMNDLENRIADAVEFKNVEANTDLDDYQETGLYFFDQEKKPQNIPAGVNGWLQVFKGNFFVKQIWYRAGTPNSNDFETYIRTKGTFWGNWKKLEIVEDTGWQDLPLKPGITTGSLKKTAKYRKVGKIVQICGDLGGITKANVVVATLPPECCPSVRVDSIQALSGVRYCRYNINTSGQITLEWISDGKYDSTWHDIDINFMVD